MENPSQAVRLKLGCSFSLAQYTIMRFACWINWIMDNEDKVVAIIKNSVATDYSNI